MVDKMAVLSRGSPKYKYKDGDRESLKLHLVQLFKKTYLMLNSQKTCIY